MTDDEYVANNGLQCPLCRSKNLEWDGIETGIDPSRVSQGVSCGACGSTWWDVYQLTGFVVDVFVPLEEADETGVV